MFGVEKFFNQVCGEDCELIAIFLSFLIFLSLVR